MAADEPLVELETDKVTLEVNAPAAGELGEILVKDGETVEPGAVLGSIVEGGKGSGKSDAKPAPKSAEPAESKTQSREEKGESKPAKESSASYGSHGDAPPTDGRPADDSGPAVAKLARESGIDPASLNGSGKDGRVTKGDMLAAIDRNGQKAPAQEARSETKAPPPRAPSAPDDAAREERVRMTKLRQTIAKRLKSAQETAAMLTTFNDVDMGAVMAMRSQYKDIFEKKHGTKLGFMGFFTKAVIGALKDVPAVNAEIDGQDLVYKNYYHIGIAVGTDKGLVVPVVRDADDLSIAGIEKKISGFGKKSARGQALHRRDAGRHLHHHQWRHLRLADVDPDPQRAAIGHSWHAPHRGAAGGAQRQDRGAADDVSGALLRSPHRRREGGRDLPRSRQGSPGGSRPSRAGPVRPQCRQLQPMRSLAGAADTDVPWHDPRLY
ncbi:2-oxoglutarate dehydrogenase E2 component (dihydrolipoamide succinyltransferase) [Methylorubrum pseudosasae]|nr:2-oxoglutarate dehydrogenase E2 component (dihydrolipoamide succinyltransferase) [Methylorubrum pseudosasae]